MCQHIQTVAGNPAPARQTTCQWLPLIVVIAVLTYTQLLYCALIQGLILQLLRRNRHRPCRPDPVGLPQYYHVLWVSKYQRVSKCSLLRDRCRKLADLCFRISPMYYPIIARQRNKEVSLCLLCDLADITGKYSKFV